MREAGKKPLLSIKNFLPRTLFGRSLMILIAPVLLLQIIATYIFFDRHWDKITTRMAYAVSGEIVVIAKSIEQDPDAKNMQKIMGFAAQNLGLLVSFEKKGDFKTVDGSGAYSYLRSGSIHALRNELKARLRRPFNLRADSEGKAVQIEIKLASGVLNVTVPQRRLYSSSGYIFLLWMTGSSLVLLSIAVIFLRNQIRPIRKLAVAAEKFGKGREAPFFKPEGASEVRQAGHAFLDMQRRIRRQMEQRTAMLAGVSHDLRTPLTRLKLQLAMMGDSPDIEAMKSDIAHMEKMIGGYLDFVRGEADETPSFTSLNDLIDKIIVSARRQGVEVTGGVRQDIHLTLRPVAFERCLNNLVSNAGKYAPHVWIEAWAEDGYILLVVDDDGPGIPEDKYEDVFRPFFRVDSSRNAATGGVGLGLPIAMDIVHAHGGKIWLEKSPQGGLRVTIKLPV